MKDVVLNRAYFAILFFLVLLTIPIQAAADDPFMVKDIELAQDLYYGVEGEFALVNDILFFVAHTGPYGTEVWKYEEGSASLLMDIRPGKDSSVPSQLTSVNGILYFIANDGIHGIELWKSDGTGTGMVEDINPSGDSSPSHLTNCNDTLYFNANDSINGLRLWKSDDGTDAGTDIVSTKVWGSGFTWVNGIVPENGIVLFSGAEWDDTFNYYEYELWKTDGTEDGTEMVKQIELGPNSGFPEYLTNVNGTVYFAGRSDYSYGPSSVELWKSDGTTDGTVQVKDINPGALASFPNDLTNLNGVLYFTANDQTNGVQLWTSDGSESGTVMVQAPESLIFSRPQNLADIAGTLYFMARASDGMGGIEVEVWKSDGTASERLKNIRPDASDAGFPVDPTFTNVNGYQRQWHPIFQD